MAKLQCPQCNNNFEMNYWKWVFLNPFHTWTKRLTKCPRCGQKSWMKRLKSK